jgi:hypothetical protein
MSAGRGARYRPPPLVLPDDPVAAAKAVALAFRQAVHTTNAAEVKRLTRGMTWQQVVALAVVMAEGLQPGDFRLLHVTRVSDDESEAVA